MEMDMAFKAISRTQALNDVVSFTLNDQRFVCKNHVTIGAILRVSGADKEKAVEALMGFFEAALMPGEYQRFLSALDDENQFITFDDLSELVGWLVEVYSGGRPTVESSSPTSELPSSGVVSTDGSSPAGVTYTRSQPIAE